MQLTMRRTAPAVILAAALALSACASANQTPAETLPDTPAMTEAAYPRTLSTMLALLRFPHSRHASWLPR